MFNKNILVVLLILFSMIPINAKEKGNLYTSAENALLSKSNFKKLSKYRLLLIVPSWLPKGTTLKSLKVKKEEYYITYQYLKNEFTVLGIGEDERGDGPDLIEKYEFMNPIFGKQYLGQDSDGFDEKNNKLIGTFKKGELYYSPRMYSPNIIEDHEYVIKFSGHFSPNIAVKIARALRYLKKYK